MDYSKEFIRLGELASEIRHYNLLSKSMITDQPEISLAMAGYIFPDLSEQQLLDVVDALRREQYITQTSDETRLIFSETFYEAYGTAIALPKT